MALLSFSTLSLCQILEIELDLVADSLTAMSLWSLYGH